MPTPITAALVCLFIGFIVVRPILVKRSDHITPTPLQPTLASIAATLTAEAKLTEAELQRAYAFGLSDTPSNADWQPSITDFDGVPMALAPVGCFNMGSDEVEPDSQCFSAPFWIDQHAVTSAQWAQVTGESAPNDRDPVAVSWGQAREFCERRGMRLPTEREWEYAVRGVNGWLYPWGSEAANGNNEDPSWIGAAGLIGGLPEWTSTIYNLEQFPTPYQLDGRDDLTVDALEWVIRGGSHGSTDWRIRRDRLSVCALLIRDQHRHKG